MRLALPFGCLILLATSLIAGDSSISIAPARTARVQLEVDADQLTLPLTITIRGKNRSAVDTRVDEIRQVLQKRFTDQPGWDLREAGVEFARPEASRYLSKSSSSLFGDNDATSSDTVYTCTAHWLLITDAEKGVKGLETLRVKGSDLVKVKNEDEREFQGTPEFTLSDPEDHRDELLDQIKADYENVQKHLPEGQFMLSLERLSGPVKVTSLGGKRFALTMDYSLRFITPKPEKTTK